MSIMAKQKKESSPKFVGLTKRWFLKSALVTIVILAILSVAGSLLVRSYYYESVSNKLKSYSNGIVTHYFDNYKTDAEFVNGAREYVSEFSEKSFIEVWVIDKTGKVIISSSGFEVEYPEMPDYYEAIDSKEEMLYTIWTGELKSGEKIMSVTNLIKDDNSSVRGAVRYITSLEAIDEQLIMIYIVIVLLFLLLVGLVMLTGIFFVSSIVKPIRQINDTTGMIAGGNLDARIDHYL